MNTLIKYILVAFSILVAPSIQADNLDQSLCSFLQLEDSRDSVAQGKGLDRQYTYYYLEGVRLKNNGKTDDAYMMFRHCIELDSLKAEAHYQIGMLHLGMNNAEQVISSLSKAAVLDSMNYWYNEHYLLALYAYHDSPNEAIVQLENMVRRFPDKISLQYQLVEMYNQAGNYDQTIASLDRIEKKLGKSEQLSMEKFKAYLAKGEEQSAYREIEELIETYPYDLRYPVVLADLYYNNDKKKKAYAILKKVLQQDPEFHLATYTLANYYFQSNERNKYKEKFEKVVFDPKADNDLKLNLLRQFIFNTEGAPEEVIPVFEKALEITPDDDQLLMLYSQYLINKEKKTEVKPILERILSIDPTNNPSRLTLLGLAIESQDTDAVIALSESGIISSPSSIQYYYYLAIAYNEKSLPDKVLKVVDKALSIVDETTPKELISDFYSLKGEAYYAMKDFENLYSAYDKALEYLPDNLGVLNNYAYYLSVRRKDLQRAEGMSKKTVEAEPQNETFLDTYAWILFELKKYTQAKIYIDKAIEHGGDGSGVILEHAGDIYYKAGNKEEAIEFWSKAYKLGGSDQLPQKIKKKKYIAD